jgi:PiT family inorganic phosphate transporter
MFQETSAAASAVIAAKGAGHSIIGDPRPAVTQPAVTQYVSRHRISEGTYPSLADIRLAVRHFLAHFLIRRM